jgi:hypothetical protein
VDRTEDCCGILVGEYNYVMTPRRNLRVIDSGNGIFVSIRRADDKRHKRHASKPSANAVDHATLYQKLPGPHHQLVIEPNVEIAADAIDVRFGNPVGTGVLGIGMTKGDMDTGNFFVL